MRLNLIGLEQQFVKILEKDLYETAKFNEDPLSNTVYLYSLARTGIMTRYVDNLIDWANGWIRTILITKQTGYYVDKDITSTISQLIVLPY